LNIDPVFRRSGHATRNDAAAAASERRPGQRTPARASVKSPIPATIGTFRSWPSLWGSARPAAAPSLTMRPAIA
jgi:hypothetical protein